MNPRQIEAPALFRVRTKTKHVFLLAAAYDCGVIYTRVPVHLKMGTWCARRSAERPRVLSAASKTSESAHTENKTLVLQESEGL